MVNLLFLDGRLTFLAFPTEMINGVMMAFALSVCKYDIHYSHLMYVYVYVKLMALLLVPSLLNQEN